MSASARKVLHLSSDDANKNGRGEEVSFEFWVGDMLEQAVVAFDKNEDGKVDTIDTSADSDGDGDVDDQEKALLIKMAELYLQMKW